MHNLQLADPPRLSLSGQQWACPHESELGHGGEMGKAHPQAACRRGQPWSGGCWLSGQAGSWATSWFFQLRTHWRIWRGWCRPGPAPGRTSPPSEGRPPAMLHPWKPSRVRRNQRSVGKACSGWSQYGWVIRWLSGWRMRSSWDGRIPSLYI